MGKAFSHLVKRPVQNYNVENRAMKALDKMEKAKPAPAPRHPTSSKFIDEFAKENPDISKAQTTKDEMLLKNMENMLANPDKISEIRSARALPINRKPHEELEYGYHEPENIPHGKVSIKQALELISMRHTEPEKYTNEYIARTFNLDIGQVERLLQYYHIFKIQMPKGSKAAEFLENPTVGATPIGVKSFLKDKLLPDKNT